MAVSGIVSFHTHPAFREGIVGVIIFMLIFCIFVTNKLDVYNPTELLKRKARRLLKPWLFWTVIYGAFKMAKAIYSNVPLTETFSAKMLLTGTKIHLWFLPFAFIAAVFLALIHQILAKNPNTRSVAIAIWSGILCLLGCAIIRSYTDLPTPFGQWMSVLPAIPLGFAMGQSMLLRETTVRRNCYLWTILLVIVACAAIAWFGYENRLAIRYCISVVVVGSALHWRGNTDPVSSKVASLSYGIYLVHPLIITVLDHLKVAAHPLALLPLALFTSAIATFFLKKTRLSQFV